MKSEYYRSIKKFIKSMNLDFDEVDESAFILHPQKVYPKFKVVVILGCYPNLHLIIVDHKGGEHHETIINKIPEINTVYSRMYNILDLESKFKRIENA